MIAAAYTITGLKHEKNQDSFLMDYDEKSGLFIVADGMGGHAAGDVASRIGVNVIRENLKKFSEKLVEEAILAANKAILSESKTFPAYEGMGTTVAMCCVEGGRAYISHVGDSRVYLVEDGTIEQLTRDHSFVQQLVDNGEITKEEAKTHSMKNIITKALGAEETVSADIMKIRLKQGSTLVLCTDGVSNVFSDEEIKEIILGNQVQAAVKMLCEQAREKGSADDITAIVISIN